VLIEPMGCVDYHMTIVNAHSSTHFGKLVTASGDSIDVGLELIGGRTLRMSLDGQELGAWPVEDCHITPGPGDGGTYLMTVDGDDAAFTPEEMADFELFVTGLSGEPVGAGSGEHAASPPEERAEPDDVGAFLFGSSGTPRPVAAPPTSHEIEDEESDGVTATEPDAVVSEDIGGSDDDHQKRGEETPRADADADADDGPPVGSDEGEDTVAEIPVPLSHVLFPSRPDEAVTDDYPERPDSAEPVEHDTESVDLHGSTSIDTDGGGASDPDDPVGILPIGTDDDVPAGGSDTDGVDSRLEEDAGPKHFTSGERFGGSSIERLSSAIGSLKQTRARDEESAATDDQIEPDGDAYHLDPNTVADQVRDSQRALRGHTKVGVLTPDRIKLGGILVGVVAVLVTLGLMAPKVWSMLASYESDAPTPSTLAVQEERITTTTTLTPATTVPATTVPASQPGQTIFDRPADEFVSRWNAEGTPIDTVLEFDTPLGGGPFQQEFTAYLKVTGVVEADGTLSTFSVVVDPTGPTQYDRIGIQALGVAIATVDPSRSPGGRATLLLNLGLNVRQPQLGGIDGRVESAGIDYDLVYDESTRLLTLTVAPAG